MKNSLFSACPKYRIVYVYLTFRFNWRPIFLWAKSGHPTFWAASRWHISAPPVCHLVTRSLGFLSPGTSFHFQLNKTNCGHFLAKVSQGSFSHGDTSMALGSFWGLYCPFTAPESGARGPPGFGRLLHWHFQGKQDGRRGGRIDKRSTIRSERFSTASRMTQKPRQQDACTIPDPETSPRANMRPRRYG